MATALASGMVHAKLVSGDQITAADKSPDALERFAAAVPGCQTVEQNGEAVNEAEVAVIAVKPQYVAQVAADLKKTLPKNALVVSIAAGVSLASLAKWLPAKTRIVRVMPNTPCLVGKGASGFSLSPEATAEDEQIVRQILEAVGVALPLPETCLDAVTGLSGAGPAFVYTIIEALSDAGVRVGLPRSAAAELAVSTLAGAAEMVKQTDQHPALLREAVTSPGGATIAGLATLEERGLRSALIEAVRAATERSAEMGRMADGK